MPADLTILNLKHAKFQGIEIGEKLRHKQIDDMLNMLVKRFDYSKELNRFVGELVFELDRIDKKEAGEK